MSDPLRIAISRDMPESLPTRWLVLICRWLLPRPPRARQALRPSGRILAVWLLGGAAAVAVAMGFLDARGVAFVRTLPPWLVDVFNELTDFGKSGWFLVPIAVAIGLAATLVTRAAGRMSYLVLTTLIVRLEFIFAAIALPSLFVTIIKRLIGRIRPSDLGPFAYMPWSWRSDYASLPSGHATTAVAAAIAIGAVWPRTRVAMWIYALIIMASRVIIQAHFVSDVIAAAFVGSFGAILVRNWYAARGLAFVPPCDGTVHAKPGPSWRRVKSVAARLLGR